MLHDGGVRRKQANERDKGIMTKVGRNYSATDIQPIPWYGQLLGDQPVRCKNRRESVLRNHSNATDTFAEYYRVPLDT